MDSTTQPHFPVLRNRLGEIWKRRDGALVTITRIESSKPYPYGAKHPASAYPPNPSGYHWYGPSLRVSVTDNNADLVEQIYDPRIYAPEYLSGVAASQPSSVTAPQPSTTPKRCDQCAAWEQLAPQGGTLGRCIRHAPILMERSHYAANWPTTSSTDSCFDFIAKPRRS